MTIESLTMLFLGLAFAATLFFAIRATYQRKLGAGMLFFAGSSIAVGVLMTVQRLIAASEYTDKVLLSGGNVQDGATSIMPGFGYNTPSILIAGCFAAAFVFVLVALMAPVVNQIDKRRTKKHAYAD